MIMNNVLYISLLFSVLIFSLVGVSCDSAAKYDLPVRTSNKFAIKLHRALASDDAYKDGNIIVSPISISMAVGLVYLGARRNTSRQIDDVFHWNNVNGINIHTGFRYLRKKLTSSKPRKNKGYEMNIANRIWAADGFPILEELKNNTRRYYGAGIATSDFSGHPNRARRKINSWVDDRTHGKIKDLIPPGLLNELTKMVMVNAMYFKGTWQRKFREATTEQWFDSASGSPKKDRVKAQMMNLPLSELNYFEDKKENCQIVELPYAGNETSMVIVLPKKKAGSNVQSLEGNLSYGKIRRWMKNLAKKNVTVYLPKFKMSLDLEVKTFLKGMGIVDLFTPGVADLSGITGKADTAAGRLFVKHVLHQAFIEVNERGTEAAAATAVVALSRSSWPPRNKEIVSVHADRPFFYFVHHKPTNVILLMGRVKRPITGQH